MIRFGTRGSRLARAQTEQVAQELAERSGEGWDTVVIETRGDRTLDVPLPAIGGKGVFTQELEQALRAGEIDAAVHSYKDLPVELPEDLVIGAVPARVSPVDVLLHAQGGAGDPSSDVVLDSGTVVGTSSPRRRCALLAQRTDLKTADIRGNVPTRIDKLREGKYGAIILASAGIERLNLTFDDLRCHRLSPREFTPAPGQGAIAVQCRRDDARTRELFASLHHEETARCVDAERALLARLGGGCSMPLGAMVQRDADGRFQIIASLYSEAGSGRPAARVIVERDGEDPMTLIEEIALVLGPLVGEPLQGARLLLLRPGGEAGDLGSALAVAGALVVTVALTEILPLSVDVAEFEDLAHTVAFSSVRAVERYFDLVGDVAIEPGSTTYFAGGPATARAVMSHGHSCLSPAEGAGGEALAELVAAHCSAEDGPVVFPCAAHRHPAFERAMVSFGYQVRAVPVYDSGAIEHVKLPEQEFDAVIFTSPSAARAFKEVGQQLKGHYLGLGPTTAEAMAEMGLPLAGVAKRPTASSLVSLIKELCDAN